MSPFVRAAVAGVVATLAIGLAGCDRLPPEFIERSTISDTNLEDGPYQVRVVVKDLSGVASLRLFYGTARDLNGGIDDGEDPDLLDLSGSAPMRMATADTEHPERQRWLGEIPGFPLGTEVEWAIEACDTLGNCGLDPPLYPIDAFRFRVGLVPSGPTISDIKPGAGPSSGGTRVVIDGTDFRPEAEVRFGVVPAPHVEWIDTTRVVARSPAHDPGVVDVFVRNPDSMEAAARGAFEFFPAPTIDSVFPDSGPTAGGTEVLILGTSFLTEAAGEVRAFFDGVPCRNQIVISDFELTCETPPGAAGLVDVEVRADNGGFGLLEDAFLYIAPPLVDGVEPDRGTDLGGTIIEVRGENFDPGATVSVDGVPCVTTQWLDEETLLCTVPAGSPGIVDVTVTNEDGQVATAVGGFNYLGPPVVVQVLPPLGPVLGGVEVRIIGAGFSENMLVLFGNSEAQILEVIDDLELVVELPPTELPLVPAPDSGLAPVDVLVQNLDPGDMRFDLVEDGFSYIWPPEVFEVIPPSGPTAGGTDVTVLGRFFFQIAEAPIELFFGEDNLATAISVNSTTSMTATTPPGPDGFVDVIVQNFENSLGTLIDGYEYIPPPIVTEVQPPRGPTFGNQPVTIIGMNFQDGAIVEFEGVGACTDVVVISETEISCTTPPAPGPLVVDVTVTNPDGQQGTGLQLYEYVPVVVEPDYGLEGGFTEVRVQAAGMETGVLIFFNEIEANDCVWQSEFEVICQSPPAPGPGFVEVAFFNPVGLTGDSAENAFEYRRFENQTEARLDRFNLAANHVEAGDLDNDGDFDLVVGHGIPGLPQEDLVFLNNGAGFFIDDELPGGPFVTNSVDFGDWNDDNLPDIVLGVSEFGGARIYINQGGGDFELTDTPTPGFGTPGGAFDAVLTDLVGDGREDLLILTIGCSNDPESDCNDLSSGMDAFFERTGPGTTIDRSSVIPHDTGLVHDHKIANPDLDGDGDQDLVLFVDNGTPEFATAGNDHRLLINPGNGNTWAQDRTPFEGLVGDVFGVTFGDIDGDNDDDVLAGNCNPPFGSSEVVYENQGGTLVRSFTALPNELDDCDWGVHLFDADDDGDLDVAFVGDRAGNLNLKIYVNNGQGQFFPSHQSLPAFPDEVQQTRGAEMASGDFDLDGDLDLAIATTDLGAPLSFGTVEMLVLVSEDDAP